MPVAERISDSVLDYIRKNGGALRLKIRLKDDGILIGWDVEEWFKTPYGRELRGVHPGGDFKEAQPANSGGEAWPYSFPLPLSEENKAFLAKHKNLLMNGDKVWEKGWYIDKNGRKSETDY